MAGDSMIGCFIAELLGTFVLVLMGDGAVASVILGKIKFVGDVIICLSFGVGAMTASFIGGKISGGHANPAVSLAHAIVGKLRWSMIPIYMVAQYLGAFLAALVLFVNYYQQINLTDNGTRIFDRSPNSNSTGQMFVYIPDENISVWTCLFDQVIGTALLVFAATAMSDPQNLGLEHKHHPLCLAFTVTATCFAFLPNCGAIFNPARDFGPRLLAWIVGYPNTFSPHGGFFWLLAGIVGPHLGAILAVCGYQALISPFLVPSPVNDLQSIKLGARRSTLRSPETKP